MPLISLVLLAIASGAAAAIASRRELRISPKHALLSSSFAAYSIFALLVLVPVSAYFYVWHGDWSLLYLVDVRTIPSAVALIAFVGQAGLGAGGFVVGSIFVRSQREAVAAAIAALFGLAAIALAFFASHRLSVVGTYAQYTGGFGLIPFTSSALLPGTILMSLLLLGGFAYLMYRLYYGARRAP